MRVSSRPTDLPFYINLYLDFSWFELYTMCCSLQLTTSPALFYFLSTTTALFSFNWFEATQQTAVALTRPTRTYISWLAVSLYVCLRMFQALCSWVLGLNWNEKNKVLLISKNNLPTKQNANDLTAYHIVVVSSSSSSSSSASMYDIGTCLIAPVIEIWSHQLVDRIGSTSSTPSHPIESIKFHNSNKWLLFNCPTLDSPSSIYV